MGKLLGALVLCVLSGMSHGSQVYNDQKVKHIAATRPLVLQMPLITTATIARDGQIIEIDFKEPGTENKIKDYDLIRLGAGRYQNLNFGKAKSVIVIGQGNLTVIHGGKDPILVNNTEFWDIYFFDVKFKAAGQEGMWALGSEFVGDFSMQPADSGAPLKFALYTAISELSFSNLPDDPSADFAQSGRFVHFLSQRRNGLSPTTENLSNYRFPRFGDKESGPLFASIGKIVEKFAFSDGVLKFNSMIVAELDYKKLHSIIDAAPSEGLNQKAIAKALVARVAHLTYLLEIKKAEFSDEKFQKLMKAAGEARAKGQKHTALALWGEADMLSSHSRLLEIRKLAEPVAKTELPDTGCRIGTDGLDSLKLSLQLSKPLYEKFPALSAPGRCVISFIAGKKNLWRDSKTEVTSSRDTYQLTREASARLGKEMARAQEAIEKAQRAAEKAAQASILAHTERMVDAAKKDEAGRLRIQGSGANKTMTYGSGNWNGNASAQTTANIDNANNEASRLKDLAAAAAAAGVRTEDMEKFKTEVDSTRVESLSVNLDFRADAAFGSEKKTFTAPPAPFVIRRICQLKNYGMQMQTCNIESVDEALGNFISAKIHSAIYPKIENLLAQKMKNASAKAKAKLKGVQGPPLVEAILSASFVEKDLPEYATFSTEYEKVSGTKRDLAAVQLLGAPFGE